MFGSYIIENLKTIGINVLYCARCRTIKLFDEFADIDKSICKICIDKPTRITAELYRLAMDKTKGKCAICSEPTTTIHHIIPKRYGGNDELDNLIPICWGCHIKAHNGSYAHDKGYDPEIAKICKSY